MKELSFLESSQSEEIIIALSGHPFRVVVAGSGTPVIMLHGFPDSAELWRFQVPALTEAGFRVIAPDLRGFGGSWKPQEVEAYKPTKLLADVVGIMHQLGVRRAHLVGHDFGAFLAWTMASLMPRRVERLVVMSVGHPNVWACPTLEQRERFWYSLLYLLPEAELILRQRNWEFLREMFAGEKDRDRFLGALRHPGALTGGLNWYRANCHPAHELDGRRRLPPVAVPTLAMWGSRDKALTEQAMLDSSRHVSGPWRYERLEDAGHFLPVDAPDRVSALLLEWLTHGVEGTTRLAQRRNYARR